MIRLEIFANRSVQEDLLDRLKKGGVASFYTLLPEIHGLGRSGARLGDATWPEENFQMILHCKKKESRKIIEILRLLKSFYPTEGIKVFQSKSRNPLEMESNIRSSNLE